MPRVSTRINSISKIKIAAVVIAGMVFLVSLTVIFISPLVFGKPYFVVYTANGEIYVGKASLIPRFHLTDAYLLQATSPPNLSPPAGGPGTNFQMVPLSSTPWAPKKIYFGQNQIIFYGPIDENSSVAATLQNR